MEEITIVAFNKPFKMEDFVEGFKLLDPGKLHARVRSNAEMAAETAAVARQFSEEGRTLLGVADDDSHDVITSREMSSKGAEALTWAGALYDLAIRYKWRDSGSAMDLVPLVEERKRAMGSLAACANKPGLYGVELPGFPVKCFNDTVDLVTAVVRLNNEFMRLHDSDSICLPRAALKQAAVQNADIYENRQIKKEDEMVRGLEDALKNLDSAAEYSGSDLDTAVYARRVKLAIRIFGEYDNRATKPQAYCCSKDADELKRYGDWAQRHMEEYREKKETIRLDPKEESAAVEAWREKQETAEKTKVGERRALK